MTGPTFIGCGWCVLRVQGCRCASPCGAAHCDAEIVSRPPAVAVAEQPEGGDR